VPFPAPVRGVRCSGDGPASAWALPGQPPRATVCTPGSSSTFPPAAPTRGCAAAGHRGWSLPSTPVPAGGCDPVVAPGRQVVARPPGRVPPTLWPRPVPPPPVRQRPARRRGCGRPGRPRHPSGPLLRPSLTWGCGAVAGGATACAAGLSGATADPPERRTVPVRARPSGCRGQETDRHEHRNRPGRRRRVVDQPR
jgi:hypothetical protein